MAILVNIGKRGFVLKEGFVGPTEQISVSQETAEKLSKMYPQDLKIVVTDKVAEPVKHCGPEVCSVAEPEKEKPAKRSKKAK